MTKQYDTQEQIDAFNIYVKQNPAGRQVHHTGTLGYDDDEWKAFQEGWNAALAQSEQELVGYEHHEYRPFGAPGEIRIHAVLKSQFLHPDGSIGGDFQWLIDSYKADKNTIKLVPLYTPSPKPAYRAVKSYHEGKPVYVASHPRTFDDYGNKIV